LPAVLVTGTSSGIGAASARLLAAQGWEVHASVRARGQAPEGTRELVFDVTDGPAVARAVGAIDHLDGVVANAGIAIAAPLELLPPEALARQLDVNVLGCASCRPRCRRCDGHADVSSSSARSADVPRCPSSVGTR
jgi:NAD(P)-dependent dehydrogenase (short-subunit alcohol dehydrogenase family)